MKYPAIELFRPISLSDREAVLAFTEKYRPLSCEYSFAGLYVWAENCGLKICFFDGKLFVFDAMEGVFYAPLGEGSTPDYLKGLSEHSLASGGNGLVAFINPDGFRDDGAYRILSAEDENEYVYSLAKLSELRGKDFLKHRNIISWFRRHFPGHRVTMLDKTKIPDCLELLEKWAGQKKDTDFEAIEEEKLVIERAFASFDEIGLGCMAIEIEGKIAAYMIFSRLSADCAVMHFSKFDRSIRGLFQTLFIEASKYLSQKYKYLNCEQDMGLPGLKYLKESYCPEMIYRCHCLVPGKSL